VNILLIRLRLIGDVVLTTPAVRALRERFPQARISYLVEPLSAAVVERNPHLDHVIVAPRRRGWRRMLDDVRLAARLRRERFDVVVDLHGGPRSSWLSLATGAPRRIGYTVAGRTWMYTHVAPRPREHRRRHSVENQWDLLPLVDPALDRPRSPETDPVQMPESPEAAARVTARLEAAGITGSDRLIVLHVGAGNEFRKWPEDAFGRVGASLSFRDRSRRIILTAGAAEQQRAARVAAVMVEAGARPPIVWSDLDWLELHSLLARAALFVGNDSGPMHLAATTGTPIVAIFGPTLEDVWAPWRSPAVPTAMVSVGALPCRPCDQRVCAPGDFRCLRRLDAATVVQAAERLLAGRPANGH
jgi:lipopolysaccharide heptosyltransferase II